MKNRIQILAMAACCMAALFTGCEKDQQHKGLKVSVEGISYDKKVHVDNNLLPIFALGDKIKVNGSEYSNSNTEVVGKFLPVSSEATAPYYGLYPASAVTGAVTAQPTIILPSTQTYELDGTSGVQKLQAPMGGANTVDEILFHNFCCVLEVMIKNPNETAATIQSIEVSSDNIYLSYPDGLQLNEAMNPNSPDNTQALVAQPQDALGEDETAPGLTNVKLTGTSTAGAIAPGGSKSFMIYLPTYTMPSGRMPLKIQVLTATSSYMRSVYIDALERNYIYTYMYSIPESLAEDLPYYTVYNSASSSRDVEFDVKNYGAATYKDNGTLLKKPTTTNLSQTLTRQEWLDLQDNSSHESYYRGVVQLGGKWGLLFTLNAGDVVTNAAELESTNAVFLPVEVNKDVFYWTSETKDKDKTYAVHIKINNNHELIKFEIVERKNNDGAYLRVATTVSNK